MSVGQMQLELQSEREQPFPRLVHIYEVDPVTGILFCYLCGDSAAFEGTALVRSCPGRHKLTERSKQ